MQSLKDLARTCCEHVNTIKIEREKIVAVDVIFRCRVHLLCLQYGLPYNYAERIHTIKPHSAPELYAGPGEYLCRIGSFCCWTAS